jgi:hypothetical protein
MSRARLIVNILGVLLLLAGIGYCIDAIDRTQGDFCAWTAAHVAALHNARTPAGRQDLAADRQLQHQLGCKPG